MIAAILSFLLVVAAPRAASELPLVVVPPTAPANGTLVILLTGDGGWAPLDRTIAKGLSASGNVVVAVNSLHYFMRPRTSAGVARDFSDLARAQCRQWRCQRVVLAGYSMGADVMPFVVNQLAPDVRGKVDQMVLLSLGHDAVFRFFPTQWIGVTLGRQFATLPALQRVRGLDILCVYGKSDADQACTALRTRYATVVGLPDNHTLHAVSSQVARIVSGYVRKSRRAT